MRAGGYNVAARPQRASTRPDDCAGPALGPTLGIGWDAAQRASFVGGFWRSGFSLLDDDARCDHGVPFASLAIGLRNLGEPELYLAPKVAVMFACPDIDL